VQSHEAGNDEGEKSLEELLTEAQTKIEQQREAMLRAVAEAENARKRAQAEAVTSQKYAIERFAQSLLPVIDSLEAAVAAAQEASPALREGVEITLRQILAAFQKASLAQIAPSVGERFDPHRHQAMSAVPSEAEPNTIAALMQKGYALHDRVLRPALVTVTRPVENQAGNPTLNTDLD
jgi:molecular chaperone GrpE